MREHDRSVLDQWPTQKIRKVGRNPQFWKGDGMGCTVLYIVYLITAEKRRAARGVCVCVWGGGGGGGGRGGKVERPPNSEMNPCTKTLL